MGVDFIPCDMCGNTFPDCGPHDQCEKHRLCSRCMPFDGSACDDGHHDSDGYLLPEYCPVCKLGGTELERMQAKVAASRAEIDQLRSLLRAASDALLSAQYANLPEIERDKITLARALISQNQ